MNINILRQFDLNSLLTLKILLETQHVTKAAEKLHLTQSAVSRTLGKLRTQLADPILVRSGKGLVLSKSAEDLLPKVNLILEHICDLLDPDEFNPSTYQGTLRLATTDYGTHNLLPKLVPLLSEAAPLLKLTTLDWRSNLLTELEKDKVDIMIGGAIDPPEHIHRRIVASDGYEGVLRRGHPDAESLDLDTYLSLKHIMISSSGDGRSQVDDTLEKLGHKRNIAMTVPHFFAALEIVKATDFMILLPTRFVKRYVDREQFEVIPAPFEPPVMNIAMFWHARTQHEPMNRWLRQFIYENLYAKSWEREMSKFAKPMDNRSRAL